MVLGTRACFLGFSLLSAFICSNNAQAWGDKGHRVVNLAAIDLMSSPAADFFRANKDALAKLSLTPDQGWKQSNFEQERPMHFFQWDRYKETAMANGFEHLNLAGVLQQIGAESVKENGSAVWRSSDIYQRLVKAFRAKDWNASLQMAGVLGHYIGDLSQPMHVSSDYDGQSIGRTGLHKYFEITLLDSFQEPALVNSSVNVGGMLRHEDENVSAHQSETSTVTIRRMAFSEGKKALDRLAEILALFERSPQDDNGLKAQLAPRLGSSASTLARVWDMAAREAGVNQADVPHNALQVADPRWFDLDRSTNGL